MSGSASILLGPNVSASSVLIVFTGSGRQRFRVVRSDRLYRIGPSINTGVNNSSTINGTLLAPSASTSWHVTAGTFNGEIITGTPASGGGGTPLSLSNVTLNAKGFRPIPEPSSFILAGVATMGLWFGAGGALGSDRTKRQWHCRFRENDAQRKWLEASRFT